MSTTNTTGRVRRAWALCLTLNLALLASLPAAALAGPFGLEMGQSYQQLAKQMPLKKGGFPGAYTTTTVPKPHADFASYQLVILPGLGLCKVQAAGKPVRTDTYGTEALAAFDKLESALTDKYGKGDHQEAIKAGSEFNRASDWNLAVLNRHRGMVAQWGMNGEPLPDQLTTISIEMNMANEKTAFVMLTYEFSNAKACYEAIAKQKNSSL